jgi:hypothetical protein
MALLAPRRLAMMHLSKAGSVLKRKYNVYQIFVVKKKSKKSTSKFFI